MSTRSRRLGLLWLAPFVPYPHHHGGAVRLYNLLRHLGNSYDIHLLCLADSLPTKESLAKLHRHCRTIRVVLRPTARVRWRPQLAPPAVILNDSAQLRQEVHNLQGEGVVDLLQLEYTSMAAYVAQSGETPAILTVHQLSSLAALRRWRIERNLHLRLRSLAAAATFYAFERRVLPHFDRVITVSEVDRQILARWLPERRLEVIPNGVDCQYYTPDPYTSACSGVKHGSAEYCSDADKNILFMGNFGHPPNVDAVLYFVREVWPRLRSSFPEVTLTILGALPPDEVRKLHSHRIAVTGRVEDTRPYLARSRALVVPLRFGSGTRIKILEAFAAGTPVVSTTLGIEGLLATPDRDYLLADSPLEFVAQLSRILRNDALHAALRASARELATEQYDWALSSSYQAAIYDDLCSSLA